jgi:hypothetical protein
VNRAAHGLLISRLYGCHHEHPTGLGLGEKRSQQLLLLLARQVFMTTTALGLVAQHRFAVAEILRMHLPDRLRLPAQGLGNLRSTQAKRGPQPDRLHTLIPSFRRGLLQQSSEPLGGSLRKRLACTHLTPPKAGSSLLLLLIDGQLV